VTDPAEIVVVSGLPRSGTSLMMQMLVRGGIPALTDEVRTPDDDNPRGYYEFERVKQLKRDKSWLPAARGHAVKMASPLLYELPANERYAIVFMQRDLDEVLASQEKMLRRLNQPVAPRDQMKRSYEVHLERIFAWLPTQPQMRLLVVNYNYVINNPQQEADRIAGFVDHRVAIERMLDAIDPSLYRNKGGAALPSQ
jgi:hypothetical protein